MTDLPAFDSVRSCPKCLLGFDGTWRRPLRQYAAADQDGPERMSRACYDCGYRWDEALPMSPPPINAPSFENSTSGIVQKAVAS